MTMLDRGARSAALLAAGIFVLCACSKKQNGDTPAGTSTPGGSAVTAGKGAGNRAPLSAPEFLDRFCAAVASGDKAYVASHTENATFSSSQAMDPKKCGGKTGKRCSSRGGGQHADADFNPVCARIKAQGPELAKNVREEGGSLRARLTDGDYLSDLIIERQGADFRLIREVAPEKP